MQPFRTSQFCSPQLSVWKPYTQLWTPLKPHQEALKWHRVAALTEVQMKGIGTGPLSAFAPLPKCCLSASTTCQQCLQLAGRVYLWCTVSTDYTRVAVSVHSVYKLCTGSTCMHSVYRLNMYAYTHTRMRIRVHMYTRAHVYAYTCIRAYMYTRRRAYTYIPGT